MSFKQYHADRMKNKELPGIAFTFGRFNPTTKGHFENFEVLAKYARKNHTDAVVYTSQVQNMKKNPLAPADKIMYLRKIVPNKVRVSDDTTLLNAFMILEDLIKNKHYKRIAFFVGGDRKSDFNDLLKYTKLWSEGTASLEIITSGERKAGISGTDLRELVKQNKFKEFKAMLPKGLSIKDQKDIFAKVKIGLGV